jgi:hypothetical protein
MSERQCFQENHPKTKEADENDVDCVRCAAVTSSTFSAG